MRRLVTYRLIQAPAIEVVTRDEVKAHARIDGTADDAWIDAAIAAARALIERDTGRALITQRWEYRREGAPRTRWLHLEVSPLAAIVSVQYVDTQGQLQTWDPAEYTADTFGQPGVLLPDYGKAWPAVRFEPGSFRVVFDAGHADLNSIPADLRTACQHAIRLIVTDWYEHRSETEAQNLNRIPLGIERLLWPHRLAY